MWGSRSKCLVERDLSGLWAPDSALPPLLIEGAQALLAQGPSNPVGGLCPFSGSPSPSTPGPARGQSPSTDDPDH